MTHFKYQVGLCMRKLCYRGIFCNNFQVCFRASAKFPGYFQDCTRGWVISFLSPEFCTPAGRGTLFRAGEIKIPGWAQCKIFR
jgi:hypothetical protein